MCAIFIRTGNSDEIIVSLKTETGNSEIREKAKNIRGSQILLKSIQSLLTRSSLSASDIKKMYVDEGPGSFTGLRVGAAVANAIAFCLQISVNEKKVGEFVYPRYE